MALLSKVQKITDTTTRIGNIMKKILKKILPKSLIDLVKKTQKRYFIIRSPRITTSKNNSDSVLQCCVAYNEYGGYCVPLSSRHRPAAQKILAGKIHEPMTIDFLISHCGEGDIIHAGTYFGDFLPAISQALTPKAKIWAFEPNPENYLCAFITKNINGLHNVKLRNAGLGEQRCTVSMMTSDSKGRALGGGSQIILNNNLVNESSYQAVEIVTVDNIVPSDRTISIIQLDVEGFEKPALAGALKTIQRCKPIIILETLPNSDWLSENILQLGYKISEKVHFNTILRET